jgi:glyoxylase-like metal-dependent hydrolase (beta-lactamase superfamily II)
MRKPFQVWKDVYAIGGPDISAPSDCCIYMIDAGGELVLIDSGAGESSSQLIDNINALGFNPQQLKVIIATHAHIDHIGALSYFQDKYYVKLISHEMDTTAIETGKGTGAELYGVPYQPCQIDIRISKAEESLTFGPYQFKLIHIPGHTPGSIAIYVDMEKRVLFGQDIHGPYIPAWGADLAQACSSLQKLIDVKADILCEGHFGIYQPASEVKRYIEGYLHQLQMTTS